jgi:transposase
MSCCLMSEGLALTLSAHFGHHFLCRPSDMRNQSAWLDRSVTPPSLRCALRLVPFSSSTENGDDMITLGIDAHKRTHTVVAVDDAGRQVGVRTTVATTTEEHLALMRWAQQFGAPRLFAVEDCRHLSRRLEADMLAAGERIVRVPPKLMAQARDAARTYGKSDPIDALAVARAAIRHPDLPAAQLDGESRELRLLVDHREDLVAERTRILNRLRWHLHELDPSWDPPTGWLIRFKHIDEVATRLATLEGTVARIASELVERARAITVQEHALTCEIASIVAVVAPNLLAMPGVGPLIAAKIVGEVADVRRFKSKDAFARHNGTAPLPVWSSNTERFRLSRTGNRQLNCALHRIALTQARYNNDARVFLARRREMGNTGPEARRALKRRLSDVVFRALLLDAAGTQTVALELAA